MFQLFSIAVSKVTVFLIAGTLVVAAGGLVVAHQINNKTQRLTQEDELNLRAMANYEEAHRALLERVKKDEAAGLVMTKDINTQLGWVSQSARRHDYRGALNDIAATNSNLDKLEQQQATLAGKVTLDDQPLIDADLELHLEILAQSVNASPSPLPANQADKKVVTDNKGQYSLPVQPGLFDINVKTKEGDLALELKQAAIKVAAGQTTNLDLKFHKPTSPSPTSKASPSATAVASPASSPAVKNSPVARGGKSGSTAASSFEEKTIDTANGPFTIDLMTFDLSKPGTAMITDTGNPNDCSDNCNVKALNEYISANGGFAGINGTYFCPTGRSDCAGQANTYFWKVWNSPGGKMINANNGLGDFDPFITVDVAGKLHFYRHWADYKADGESLKAGISSKPELTYQSKNSLDNGLLDDHEKNDKINREALGVKGQTVYALSVKKATVPDLAAVTTALGLDGAVNLDSGGSAAMRYKDVINFSGRAIPNAVIFKESGQ